VADILRKDRALAESDGVSCPYEIDNDQRDPFVRLISRRDDELLHKLKRISPYEFEGVCKAILDSLGANARRTQQSADGGVDFSATGLRLLAEDFPWPHHCTASVIGQAKRYTEQSVYERDLRELVGASLLYQIDLRRTENIPPLAPVLLALWTTSDFHINAKKFARQLGVWLMDGETMCAYLNKLAMRDGILGLSDAE
jgi:restriction endonuclease Mrr